MEKSLRALSERIKLTERGTLRDAGYFNDSILSEHTEHGQSLEYYIFGVHSKEIYRKNTSFEVEDVV